MDTIIFKPRKKLLTIVSMLFLIFFANINTISAADGEKLFKQNCAVCHSMKKNKLTGPGLEGLKDRIPAGDWINKWIKDSKGLIDSGDAYAVKIGKFDTSVMPSFVADLSEEEVEAISQYILNPPVKVVVVDPESTGGTAAEPESDEFGMLLSIISILIIALFILRGLRMMSQ
jgi:cytochrome c553